MNYKHTIDPRELNRARRAIDATFEHGGGTFDRDLKPVDVTGHYVVGGWSPGEQHDQEGSG